MRVNIFLTSISVAHSDSRESGLQKLFTTILNQNPHSSANVVCLSQCFYTLAAYETLVGLD